MGITVPIVLIKPIAVKDIYCHKFSGIDLIEDLIHAVEQCKSAADIKQVGIEWAIQQSLELKAAGFPYCIITLWENLKISGNMSKKGLTEKTFIECLFCLFISMFLF